MDAPATGATPATKGASASAGQPALFGPGGVLQTRKTLAIRT